MSFICARIYMYIYSVAWIADYSVVTTVMNRNIHALPTCQLLYGGHGVAYSIILQTNKS